MTRGPPCSVWGLLLVGLLAAATVVCGPATGQDGSSRSAPAVSLQRAEQAEHRADGAGGQRRELQTSAPCNAGQSFDGTTCAEVACPTNSTGNNVTAGCSCEVGYLGMVRFLMPGRWATLPLAAWFCRAPHSRLAAPPRDGRRAMRGITARAGARAGQCHGRQPVLQQHLLKGPLPDRLEQPSARLSSDGTPLYLC